MEMKTKLSQLRKNKGLTQMDLAEKLNVSRQAVSRWESGLAIPSIVNLKFMGELYGVPVDQLLDDELDLPREENCAPAEQITENVEKGKKKVPNQVIVAACILLVAAIVLICIVTRLKSNMEITPIGEMKVEDFYEDSTVEEFAIEW